MTTKREYAQDLLVLYFRGLYRDTSSELHYNEDEIRAIIDYIFDGVLDEIKEQEAATPATGTVAVLREALEGLADDLPVILSRDGEGNGYCPLSEADIWYYSPSTGDTVSDDDLAEYGQPDSVPALVLWPVGWPVG